MYHTHVWYNSSSNIKIVLVKSLCNNIVQRFSLIFYKLFSCQKLKKTIQLAEVSHLLVTVVQSGVF